MILALPPGRQAMLDLGELFGRGLNAQESANRPIKGPVVP
jgi:hypothetical protein